jgi:hypothetical protein
MEHLPHNSIHVRFDMDMPHAGRRKGLVGVDDGAPWIQVGWKDYPSVSGNRVRQHVISRRGIGKDDVKSDNLRLFQLIEQARVVSPVYGPSSQTVEGAFVDRSDEDLLRVRPVAPEAKKEIVGVIIHSIKKPGVFDRSDQAQPEGNHRQISKARPERHSERHRNTP